jgi:rhodanese-related sulfurtransferase
MIEQHGITPEELYSLLGSHRDVALFDVWQPLDLLAHAEIIPGARRIPPAEVLAAPGLIPEEKEAIVYCTCAGENTSRAILGQALDMQFFKIKFLMGGLEAWKAKGYPVEPYERSFIFTHQTLFSTELCRTRFSHSAAGESLEERAEFK